MKIQALHLGMTVKHPRYGMGTVKSIAEHTAEIEFNEGRRMIEPETGELEPAEVQASVTGLNVPLRQLIDDIARRTIDQLGLEIPGVEIEQLGTRWLKGRLVAHPADPALQTKEIPIETLFHKIVLMRNNLRVLEQKINSHPQLTDADKVEMQQYITRCYGSMTSFNFLFRNKEDQFST